MEQPNYPYLAGKLESIVSMIAYDLSKIMDLTGEQVAAIDKYATEKLTEARKAAVEYNK